ncbi:Vi polysaccharide biosynthesis protein VipB/TviC [Syntrophobacter sp. SbD1]|nr:Vi polysaccharide biosynthesis protein VipB/TviC [Syntrophobacter sp. SbD1]
MSKFDIISAELCKEPKKWLITGVAGFIGSNLLEALLELHQSVVGMDNFFTGYPHNLEDVKRTVGPEKWRNFEFIEGDIRSSADCRRACAGVDYVLHQAALGSVPRSIDDPITTNTCNVDGFLQMLVAAMEAHVKRFVFASSSSVYGDNEKLPKVEDEIGSSLSPYAASKLINEIYAGVFSKVYDLNWIGLRYFNVFGKRQDPKGAYAAVIPCWIDVLINQNRPLINGDGETSRDFCYIKDVIQGNILAALSQSSEALNRVYNIACGNLITLNQLLVLIRSSLSSHLPEVAGIDPEYGPFRKGDVRHSLADISLANQLLGYQPRYSVATGMEEAIHWYARKQKAPML